MPARQSFDACELSRPVHDGLEEHFELVVDQAAAQLVLERHALHGLCTHGRIEQRPLTAAEGLGPVHRRIRVAHHVDGREMTVADHHDANARADRDRTPLHDDGLHQRTPRARGDVDGILGAADLVQQQRELVAAEARHGVFLADAGGQTLGDGVQQHVAGRGTQAVVYAA